MPSIDHCLNKTSEITTLTNSLEVFDTYKRPDEDKESDEESFHLPIDDDEPESKTDEVDSLDQTTEDTEGNILNTPDENPEKVIGDKCNEDSQSKVDITENIDVSKTAETPTENLKDLNEEDPDKSKEESSGLSVETPNEVESNIEKPEVVEKLDVPIVNDEEEKETIKPDNAKEDTVIESSEENGKNAKDHSDEEKDDEPVNNKSKLPDNNEESETGISKEDTDKSCENQELEQNRPTQDDQTEGEIMDTDVPVEETSETVNEKLDERNEVNPLDDKCENSNDSDDLMDVTVIRDANEDNAESAYNEAHPEECDDCDDNGSEKAENDEDDNSKIDLQELNSELHTDEVDIDEQPIKSDVSDDADSDSGNKFKDKLTSEVQIDEKDVNYKIESELLDKSSFAAEQCSSKKIESETDVVKVLEKMETGDSDKRSSLKRLLQSDSEDDDTTIKRHKSGEDHLKTDSEDKCKKSANQPHILKSLSSLSQFMKEKKLKKLSIYDLEQFCLQKVCEAIVYKSELGDVHHQLKQQEQLIDSMKKEIVGLSKQATDLETVNKRLINDLKQTNSTQKVLAPLKITRSVGLQVKFVPTNETSAAKKRAPVVLPKLQKVAILPNSKLVKTPPTTPLQTTRQLHIASPQKVQSPAAKPQTPILSHALQNRRFDINNAKTPVINNNNSSSNNNNNNNNNNNRAKPPEKKSSSVIDLTDEDDKKLSSPSQSIRTIPLRTSSMRQLNATSGLRLATTTAQGKAVPMTSVLTNTTAPQQVMYVVQSPNNGMGSKALLVNFQPNAVIAPGLNGSSVSMIQKANSAIQLKTVPQQKGIQKSLVKLSLKHPAPLPAPPIIRVQNEKSLKSIPPKPHLTIRKTDTGIILQWRMPYELEMYEAIASYQLYAYQETNALPSTEMWRRVGDVKALALPMACTLTQFADKNKYYFAVRPVDVHKRIGAFSEPEEISL